MLSPIYHQSGTAVFYQNTNSSIEHHFSIGFPFELEDNKGTFHVLEHMILCGSNKYPSIDNYLQIRGSGVLTHFNAYTKNDWIGFEFSTRDVSVYLFLVDFLLDSCLSPLLSQDVFDQECFAEFKEPDGTSSYSGVVLNEMIAVLNTDEAQKWIDLKALIFKDTPYAKYSGGIPNDICNLDLEMIKLAHQSHCSLERATVFSSTSVPIQRILELLDNFYLAKEGRVKNQLYPLPKANSFNIKIEGRPSIKRNQETSEEILIFANSDLEIKQLLANCLVLEELLLSDQSDPYLDLTTNRLLKLTATSGLYTDFPTPFFIIAINSGNQTITQCKEALLKRILAVSISDFEEALSKITNRLQSFDGPSDPFKTRFWNDIYRSNLYNRPSISHIDIAQKDRPSYSTFILFWESSTKKLISSIYIQSVEEPLLNHSVNLNVKNNTVGNLSNSKEIQVLPLPNLNLKKLVNLKSKVLFANNPKDRSQYYFLSNSSKQVATTYIPLEKVSNSVLGVYPIFELALQMMPHSSSFSSVLRHRSPINSIEKSYLALVISEVTARPSSLNFKSSKLRSILDVDMAILRERLIKAKLSMIDRIGHQLAIFDAGRFFSKSSAIKSITQGIENVANIIQDQPKNESIEKWLHFITSAAANSCASINEVFEIPVDTVETETIANNPKLMTNGSDYTQTMNRYWITSAGSGYCGVCYRTCAPTHALSPVYTVLAEIFSNNIILPYVRSNGLAYSGGALSDASNGTLSLYSYRDLNPIERTKQYSILVQNLKKKDISVCQLQHAKQRIFSKLLQSYQGSSQHKVEFYNQYFGRSLAFRQKYRESLMAVTLEDIEPALTFLQSQDPVKSVISTKKFSENSQEWEIHQLSKV